MTEAQPHQTMTTVRWDTQEAKPRAEAIQSIVEVIRALMQAQGRLNVCVGNKWFMSWIGVAVKESLIYFSITEV